MIRTLCIAICFLFSQWTYCQNTSPTDTELVKFSKVFIQQKVDLHKFETKTIEVLDQTGMSHERYGEILRAQFTGDQIIIKAEEQSTIDALANLKTEFQQEKEETLSRQCTEVGLTSDRYNEINQNQRKDYKTKQRLQSFLKKELKQQ